MKYSTFKYGGNAPGSKYGTDDPVEYLTWYFGIFWDDAFVDESALMIDLQADRGRDHLLSSGGGWERFRAGEAVGTFDNSDGRFDPYNAGGPLYGFLLPGRVARITVTIQAPFEDFSTTYPVLRGIIDDIRTTMSGGKRQATIIVKDGLEWLDRRSIALALVEDAEALVTAAAIATQVGFDAVDDWTIAQLGTDSVTVPFAWGNNNRAISLIDEFVDAEAGQVYHSKDGVLTFVTNDYTETDTTDIDDAQGHITRDFELKTPWEVVRTRTQINANPRIEGTPVVLWTFGNEGVVASWVAMDIGDTLFSPPSWPTLFSQNMIFSPIEIDAIFSDPDITSKDPVVDWEGVRGDPVPTTNNWVDASPPGGFTLTQTDIGTGYRLNWVWGGDTDYLYGEITFANITATPIELSNEIVVTVSDSAAIVIYGEKTFELDNDWIQSQTYAQQYADYVIAQLKDAHLFPIIIVENRGSLQYGSELYVSKIHLTIPTLGIDDTFRVGKISHRWLNENGFATQTVLRLEPVLGVL